MQVAGLAIIATSLLAQHSAASRPPVTAQAEIPGATLHITVRQPVDDAKAAEIIDWLRDASANVARVYGRFPNPAPRVVVVPSARNARGGSSPVPFGRVTRERVEQVELYVNTDRPIEDFYADWTATHEFSHLMLPYVSQRHRWISEGFASYYQNVLMARAGHYTTTEAWQYLYEGFERGRKSRPELSPNEAAREGVRRARMKIYWSGAAIALLADIELRERSQGSESLDVALDRLQQCCLPSRRNWSGPELFRKLDTLVEAPVFMPLYRRHADTPGFPDVAHALSRLGIATVRSRVRMVPRAELAGIRDAITGEAR